MAIAQADLGKVLAAVGTPSQPKLRPKRQLDRSNVRSSNYLFTQTELTDEKPKSAAARDQAAFTELLKVRVKEADIGSGTENLEQSMAEMEAAICQLKDSQMKEMQGPRYLLGSEDEPQVAAATADDFATTADGSENPSSPEGSEAHEPDYLPKRPSAAAGKGKGGRKAAAEGSNAQFLFTPSELIDAHRRGVHLASAQCLFRVPVSVGEATGQAAFMQRRGLKLDKDLRSRNEEMEELERDLTPREETPQPKQEERLSSAVPPSVSAFDDTAAMVRDLAGEAPSRRIGFV